jgi:hypothetical protein
MIDHGKEGMDMYNIVDAYNAAISSATEAEMATLERRRS